MTLRAQSALDGFDPNANGAIRVIVVQPQDGKILIGGEFTTLAPNGGPIVTRNHIARLNPDGTLDAAFDPNANGAVYAIALQADGKILVGGNFSGPNSIGGQTRNFIARLDPTTGATDSFDPNAGNAVLALAVQGDGKILAGGLFNGANSIGGQTRNFIARLDAETGAADSFDPNANSYVTSLLVQENGRIVAGGDFSGANSIGGQTRNRIARLDATTGLADSFDPNANSTVLSIAQEADGKIIAGGDFSGPNSIGGQARNFIARLDPVTGTADSFNPNASSVVFAVAVQPDGRILAGGSFATIGGQTRNHMARLDRASGLADSFDPSTSGSVFAISVQQDNKVLVGGDFTAASPVGGAAVTRNHVARLEKDGRLDQGLSLALFEDYPSTAYVLALAVQPDGKILIGGEFLYLGEETRYNWIRLNTDGTVDRAFNPPIYRHTPIDSIAVQADGKILVELSIASHPFVTRLNADGTVDSTFTPNPDYNVFSIAVQADGKILVGGDFGSIGGQTRHGIARLDATTGLADSFNPNANGSVSRIVVQADGKILVGGDFFSIGGQMRNGLARLDGVSGLADSFNPNNFDVHAITVQLDGKVLAGGHFTSIGGQPRNHIARLDAVTGLPDSFDPNANNYVEAITVQADGKVLVAGYFTNIGGQPRSSIARLDGVTGLADSFHPNAGAYLGIALLADGKVMTSGPPLARLSNDAAALQNLAVTQSNITWTLGGSIRSSPSLLLRTRRQREL